MFPRMKSLLENSSDEVEFKLSEMFVSRTDKKGIILAGNEVFIRVSGYEREELIGKPHNRIRHSDMPKSVFKLFWDHLKGGTSVCAYVKNRSKDGRYYWVFATAFPIETGYLSIRIKPSSDIFEKVKILYGDLLIIEKEKGVEAASKVLLERLQTLGFANYNSFMLSALRAEIKLRDESVALVDESCSDTDLKKPKNRALCEVRFLSSKLAKEFRKTSATASESADLKKMFETHSSAISAICERLEHLTLNMSISAHKLGKEGATLSVVASNFQERSRKIVTVYKNFQNLCSEFVVGIERILLDLLTAKLQIEMLSLFTGEIINSTSATNSDKSDLKLNNDPPQGSEELTILLFALRELFASSVQKQRNFYQSLRELRKTVVELHQFSLQMELIITGGKLEGSRSQFTEQRFAPFLLTMVAEIGNLRKPISELLSSLGSVESTFSDAVSRLGGIQHSIQDMLNLRKHDASVDKEVARGA